MTQPGAHMKAEIAEAPGVFARALAESVSEQAEQALSKLDLGAVRALYTIARGSSDAAANILAYEFMRELGKPMTSLPPSVYSVGRGVSLADALAVVVSQSGASEDLVRSAQGRGIAGRRWSPSPTSPALRWKASPMSPCPSAQAPNWPCPPPRP